MTRKVTKKSLKRKLDQLCSQIVRARGICAKCGKTDYEHLQTAHIFSRSNLAVRWDMMNLLCLCDSCHFWSHKNPVLFGEFVKEYLAHNYIPLICKANSIKKWNVEELESMIQTYKQGLE